MEITHKATVLKEARENKIWRGYVAPNNVNSYHIKDGWHIGCPITITRGRDDKYYVISMSEWNSKMYEPFTELETWLNHFKHWNCNTNELGKRVRFWNN